MKKKEKQPSIVGDLENEISELWERNVALIKEKEVMQEQEIGYRAVISYLENQLGLKDSMWGDK